MRLLPLGGLGEFGANSMLVDDGAGSRVVLDVGAAFAGESGLGVSHEVPDFAAIGGPPPHLVVLSHAHDDHCKGLGTFLQAWPGTQLAASRTTHAWVRPALPGGGRTPICELAAGALVAAGGWQVDALPVSHSIPGSLVVRLRGDSGTLVLVSDLRLTPSALGAQTPLDALARWGKEGVDVLLLDATNALVGAAPPGEETVAATLAELVRGTSGMAVVVTFASHLGRFRQAALAALSAGRVLVPLGRGLLEALTVQSHLGGLGLPLGLVRPASELPKLPRDQVVLVATGSQGEARAAFTRLATGTFAGLHLLPGDRVLHAARVIPGVERSLAWLFDQCVRQGASVITAGEVPIHASGHPHRGELEDLVELLRPRSVLPVHGWRRHQDALAGLARHHGAAAVVADNGDELIWDGGELAPSGRRHPLGRLIFGDEDGERLDSGMVHQRRVMARAGVVMAFVLAHGGTPPVVRLRAVGLRLDADEIEGLEAAARGEAGRLLAVAGADSDDVGLTMERWLQRELRRRNGQRPFVLVRVVSAPERGSAPVGGPGD